MTCYSPIPACFSKSQYAKTGKKNIHLVLHENYDEHNKVIKDEKWKLNESSFPHALYEYIFLPCRKCVGCRSDNAKMWSLRAYNEMKLHKKNCFITLTYDNASDLVVKDPLCIASLRYKHFQNFMKRLRKKTGKKLGYLVCGEYGLKDGRAHWHAILFDFDFDDKELIYVKKGYKHYYSALLQECWSTYDKKTDTYTPIGFIDLADCDYDCCSYVSQYVLKKLPVNQNGITVGTYVDDVTGEVKEIELTDVCPPMVRSSKNPAIGYNWYKKYGENACEKGFIPIVTNEGKKVRKVRTPAYYYSKFEVDNPQKSEILKNVKEEKMRKYYKENPIDLDKLKSWSEAHLYRIKKRMKEVLTSFKK